MRGEDAAVEERRHYRQQRNQNRKTTQEAKSQPETRALEQAESICLRWDGFGLLVAVVIKEHVELGVHRARARGAEEHQRALNLGLDPRGLRGLKRDLVDLRLDLEDAVRIGGRHGAVDGRVALVGQLQVDVGVALEVDGATRGCAADPHERRDLDRYFSRCLNRTPNLGSGQDAHTISAGKGVG